MTLKAVAIRNDTQAFLDVSDRLLTAGCRVRFRACGTSMRPAIRDGETVTVESVEPTAVKPGDVLLYHHKQRPFAHRVVEIQQNGGEVIGFTLRGDAKAGCDAPVKPDQIIGRVVFGERSLGQRLLSYLRHQWRAPRATRQT